MADIMKAGFCAPIIPPSPAHSGSAIHCSCRRDPAQRLGEMWAIYFDGARAQPIAAQQDIPWNSDAAWKRTAWMSKSGRKHAAPGRGPRKRAGQPHIVCNGNCTMRVAKRLCCSCPRHPTNGRSRRPRLWYRALWCASAAISWWTANASRSKTGPAARTTIGDSAIPTPMPGVRSAASTTMQGRLSRMRQRASQARSVPVAGDDACDIAAHNEISHSIRFKERGGKRRAMRPEHGASSRRKTNFGLPSA